MARSTSLIASAASLDIKQKSHLFDFLSPFAANPPLGVPNASRPRPNESDDSCLRVQTAYAMVCEAKKSTVHDPIPELCATACICTTRADDDASRGN